MTFHVYSRKPLFRPRQWYWRLRAANGEIIAQGEGYNKPRDCYQAIELIQHGAADAPIKTEMGRHD
jgi:uncharacterized protein YegP (UPF0339 family)